MVLERKLDIKVILEILVFLAIAALAIAAVNDALTHDSVNARAGASALTADLDALTVTNVRTQSVAKKAGKSAEAKELDEIRTKITPLALTISRAERTQSDYYDALSNERDASALRSELEGSIPKAREALTEMKKLVDRQIDICKKIGDSDGAAIAADFYKAHETAVNTLQIDPFTDDQVQARDKDIQDGSKTIIASARKKADEINPSDLDADDKKTLGEVAVSGKKGISDMKDVVNIITKLIPELQKSLQDAMGSIKGAGGIGSIAKLATGGGGPNDTIDSLKKIISNLQNLLNGVNALSGEFTPFVDTVEKLAK
ncbi:MAG: hypothetical protein LBQ58_04345 [Synergistaceae bacterium]|nr:hypothetical protein [Synergistaceae bacterium]